MKKIVREYEFTPSEEELVRSLAHRLGITETTAGILTARGQDTEEKMRRFLNPSKENFLSPFLMSGMREAAELLKRAKEEDWRVAVFGDYDADGIGACAILARALGIFGIQPYLYIPEREEGYGMSIRAIDTIFDEFLPDLIVTVDCGISNAAEVEYIKNLGAYVIVTDHHELPEHLPDCICVNPKLKDDYPFDNLCGAGVAFKLSCALIGERAYDFLDFCALSTVADSVPLLGENRDIVYEGLKRISQNPRPSIAALLGKQTEITAQTLAFTLVPRVNAAGRMGDAQSALKLFLSDDEEEISALAEKLNSYNCERQTLCDELCEQAREQISREGAYSNVVMLVGEDWHAGLIGIAAARLAEEFCRPALLLVRRGNMLRGSARSIESVNIFEALKSCSEYIEEFGGHSQAAGVNVSVEKFPLFKEALNKVIGAHYTREDFEPRLPVCGVIEGEFPRELAEEINRLEPFGVGNKRPMFVFRAKRLNALPLKPGSPHLSVAGKTDFMYFGGGKDLKLLRSDIEKQLVFEANLSKFRGRESVKGFVRAVVYDGACGTDVSLDGFESLVRSLSLEVWEGKIERMEREALARLIGEKDEECPYGLCVVAQERESLRDYPVLSAFPREIYRLSSGSVRNAVLLAPAADCDLSAYRDVVFLECPDSLPFQTGKAKLYADGGKAASGRLKGLDLSREAMAEVFTALRKADGRYAGDGYAEISRNLELSPSREQAVFALAVFEELGLFSLKEGRIGIVRGKKTELTNSRIYRRALQIIKTE